LFFLKCSDFANLALNAFQLLLLFGLVGDSFLLKLAFDSFGVRALRGLNLHRLLPLTQIFLQLDLLLLDLLALVRCLLLERLNQWFQHQQDGVEFRIGAEFSMRAHGFLAERTLTFAKKVTAEQTYS
jgi:hypothetical protein